jgi:diguanylate cyclase (GGDEF)-like protein
MRALRALEIREERALAGTVAGLLYLIGSVTVAVLLVLPGADTDYTTLVLACAGVGFLWALACLFVIKWETGSPWVSHLGAIMAFPLVATAMATTGGATSPARFYLFFIVVYCSYFYRPREALPYLVGCVGLLALPFAYDASVPRWYLGEIIVLVPAFFLLGGLIMAGKAILVDLSRHDSLTGLVNRRAFTQHLRERVGGRRSGDHLGLMLVDLDGFKDANTTHGHPAGDEVLRCTASALVDSLRGEDMVARLGGDEFAIVAAGADEVGMRLLAERVINEIHYADRQLDLPGYSLRVSAGWAIYPRDAENVDDLIATADLALRGAKANGKDGYLSPLDWAPEQLTA